MDPILRSARLALRRLTEDDSEDFFAMVESSRAHLHQWLPWVEDHQTEGHSQSFLAAAEMQEELDNGGLWGIFVSKELMGTVALHWIQWEHASASMGYWLKQSATGKGFAREACLQLLQHGFVDLQLNRIEISVAVRNLPSLALAKKLGFQEEGIRRQSEKLHGIFEDHLGFSMLKQDFLSGYGSNHFPVSGAN
jgi:RimJ/RimL family protein N-acetyltransferase